tara:strand:- start:975 stop:2228 length:1254 start_codon:yes stop_codon:yes gene_type:complete
MANKARRLLLKSAIGIGVAVASTAIGTRNMMSAVDIREIDVEIEGRKGQLGSAQDEKDRAEAILAATQARRSSLQTQLRVTDEARFREIVKLQKVQARLDSRELERQQTRQQIEVLSSDFDESIKAVNERLRALYKASRRTSHLELILSAESFSQGLDRVGSLESVLQQDIADIRDLLDRKREIEIRQSVLNQQLAEIETLKKERQSVQQEIDRRMSDHKALMARVQEQEAELAKDVAAFEAEAEAIRREIASLRNKRQAEIDRLERQRAIEAARRIAGQGGAVSGWVWPVLGIITADYGGCTFGQCPHLGIDIAAPLGTPILAAADGVVLKAGYAVPGNRLASYGMTVIIAHSNTEDTLYAHLADITLPPTVSEGQFVSIGDVIGYMGVTGWTSGPHLHFEYRVNNRKANPRQVLG